MRIVKHICSVILLVTSLSYANAAERIVTISAPNSLIASGFFDYIFPRFKLKTQISVKLVPDSAMISISKNSGRAFLQMGDILYKIDINEENNYSLKFFDWLKSDVGKKTISSIQKNDEPIFIPIEIEEVVTRQVKLSGDAKLGLEQSHQKCARCHVVEKGRKNSIGSTPSFFALRTFEDWDLRFSGFYLLRPHPAFTIIPDVTEPFDDSRPAPIVPIELDLNELQAIIAYVQSIPPADLGEPVKHQ